MEEAKRNSSSSSSNTDEDIQAQVAKAVEDVKELQDSAASFISRTSTDEQALRQRSQSLDSSIRRLRSQLYSLLSSKALDPKLAEKASSFMPFLVFICSCCLCMSVHANPTSEFAQLASFMDPLITLFVICFLGF